MTKEGIHACDKCGNGVMATEDHCMVCGEINGWILPNKKYTVNPPPKDISFSTALKFLKDGYKVKRAHWGGYWTMEEWHKVEYEKSTPLIVAYLKDGGYAPAQAYQEDLLAEDWEVVE